MSSAGTGTVLSPRAAPHIAYWHRPLLLRSPGPEPWGQLTFPDSLRDLSAATESEPFAEVAPPVHARRWHIAFGGSRRWIL